MSNFGSKTNLLIVGATGQLGIKITHQASFIEQYNVRALVRPTSDTRDLLLPGIEIARGDLRSKKSLEAACKGIDIVIATATVVFPKGTANFTKDEERGYANLLAACQLHKVRQIIFISVAVPFEPEYLRWSLTYRMKSHCENIIRTSGLTYTFLRCTPFMDDYFAIIGSRIPLFDEPAATLNRSRGVTRLIRKVLGRSIDYFGFAIIPGKSTQRHAFVAVSDVSSFVLASIDNPQAKNKEIMVSGPEALSWIDIAAIYTDFLKRPVRIIELSRHLLFGLTILFRPISHILSNQLSILWIIAVTDTDSHKINAELFGITLTSARAYLENKVTVFQHSKLRKKNES